MLIVDFSVWESIQWIVPDFIQFVDSKNKLSLGNVILFLINKNLSPP